ncbi:MAG TPA: hypothetical protein VJN69_14455 [Candidatus Acidoferrales bacterium]|nr:hypothetical protein [Candidatus Acidoferrales bacterium]
MSLLDQVKQLEHDAKKVRPPSPTETIEERLEREEDEVFERFYGAMTPEQYAKAKRILNEVERGEESGPSYRPYFDLNIKGKK